MAETARADRRAVGNATPLISLDAIFLDTETTGLDPSKARLIEVGLVPMTGGKLDEAAAFRQLLNPGEAIPLATTKIHHIDDAMVADAASFSTVWLGIAERLGESILIGHTLGFDLAVLKQECERAKFGWRTPRTLDTRLLAQVVEPRLSGHSLEHLASWLNVPIEDRHSAVGDAIMTARIFLALLPRLRDSNIRTLAEAEKACLALTEVLDEQHRAGWEQAVAHPPGRTRSSLDRIDTYPYRHRIANVMTQAVKTIPATASLCDALNRMLQEKISSLLVTPGLNDSVLRVADAAIVTERDLLRALGQYGVDALPMTVGSFANRPVIALPREAFVYRALGRMGRHRLRHLVVENEEGEVCGIVSSRDLLKLRAQEATILGDAIDTADDIQELGAAWAQLPRAAEGLLAEGVDARTIAAVISRELCELTRRAGVLAERRMAADGKGGPPCPYALCVLGSAGRGESLLAMDQDNALIFSDGEPGGTEDRWFTEFATIVADILHEVGVPYCTGGIMAKNDAWRGSLATWRARLTSWLTRSSPADLLAVDIFYDLLAVHGDARLANEIWRSAFDDAKDNVVFAKLLAESGGEVASSLTLLGGIRTDNGRIDLKRAGLFGIVKFATVLAVRYHIVERSTPVRLAGAAALGRGGADLEALSRAQAVFLDLILAQQLADTQAGRPPGSAVEVRTLNADQRATLKSALGAVQHLGTLTQDFLY